MSATISTLEELHQQVREALDKSGNSFGDDALLLKKVLLALLLLLLVLLLPVLTLCLSQGNDEITDLASLPVKARISVARKSQPAQGRVPHGDPVAAATGPPRTLTLLVTPEGGSAMKVVCEVASLSELEEKLKADLPGFSATDGITILQGGNAVADLAAVPGKARLTVTKSGGAGAAAEDEEVHEPKKIVLLVTPAGGSATKVVGTVSTMSELRTLVQVKNI